MTLQHILRLNQKGNPTHAYHLDVEHKRVQEQVVNSWDALEKESHKNIKWALMLPAAWVYQSHTAVPSKSSEVLKQSIPYAVEEELSNDIEDNHFAFHVLKENKQKVAVISKTQLNQLKALVQKHKIKVDFILSEVDFCPKNEDTVSIWLHDEIALLCMGEGEALTIEKQQLADMLPVFAANLKYIQCNKSIDEEWLKSGLKVKEPLNLSSCFATLADSDVVNIMPVDWLKSNEDQTPQSNKRLLVMAVLLVLSWVGIKSYQHINVNQQLDHIKQQQLDLFSQRFGNASGSELMDPYAALQSRMQRVNQNDKVISPLLSAVQHLGVAIQNHRQQIDINALRLVDQKLEIQITAESMTLINRFQESLQQAALGFKVLIGVNEQYAGRFKSVITMEQM